MYQIKWVDIHFEGDSLHIPSVVDTSQVEDTPQVNVLGDSPLEVEYSLLVVEDIDSSPAQVESQMDNTQMKQVDHTLMKMDNMVLLHLEFFLPFLYQSEMK